MSHSINKRLQLFDFNNAIMYGLCIAIDHYVNYSSIIER